MVRCVIVKTIEAWYQGRELPLPDFHLNGMKIRLAVEEREVEEEARCEKVEGSCELVDCMSNSWVFRCHCPSHRFQRRLVFIATVTREV